MALLETTLADLRTLARQFADMTHSQFVTDDELNRYINLGVRQLYNKFVEVHGQEYFLRTSSIELAPPRLVYELPDDLVGVKGVDWSAAEPPSVAETEVVTGGTVISTYEIPLTAQTDTLELRPYAFGNRHDISNYTRSPGYASRCSEPPRYRVLASKKSVEATGEAVATEGDFRVNMIRLSSETTGYLLVWYWPEVPRLANDTDSMPMFHGFEEYPAIIAAIMMLAKEESDTTALQIRRKEVEKFIETVGGHRDVGAPEPTRDVERY